MSGSVTPSDITVDVSGQDLTFPLVGERSFSYRVNTSSSSGRHQFPSGSQLTYGVDKDVATVGGESSVTVEQAQQSSVSVTRSINPDSVSAGGGVVTVTIGITGGYGVGSVVEKLPPDFSYVSGSVMPSDITVDVSGQDLTFPLVGERSFSYRVNTSTSSGRHRFPSGSKLTYGVDKISVPVRGESSVTVGTPPPPPAQNRAPAFSRSSTTRPIVENSASGANVGAVVRATDADGDRLTYSLTGTDAGSFTINSSTGQIMVRTGTTLDYETKASYIVTVTATDPAGDSDSIAVTIIVTDVVELGMVSGDATAEYAENGMGAVATYTADGPVTAGWSVSGADMDDFDISNEGVLSFASAPDFEMPMGGADSNSNNYMVTVKAEAGGEMEMVEVTVMVTNVDEIGTLSGPETVSNYMENSEDPVGTYTVSGGSMSEMANLTLEGDDAGDFSISSAGVLSFRSSPDFENPTDADMDNTYMVTVKAEAGGEMAMQPVTVTVTNVDETTEPEPDTLMERYDTNKDGEIQKSEVITAINDYLFGDVGIISKADVIRLINLYLFG